MSAPTPTIIKNGGRGWNRHGQNNVQIFATWTDGTSWADQVLIDLSTAFTTKPYPLGTKIYKINSHMDGTCTGLSLEWNFATDVGICDPVSPTTGNMETFNWLTGNKSKTSEMWDNCATSWTVTTNVTQASETTIVVPDTVDATPTSQKLTLATAFTTGKIGYITGATDAAEGWEGVSLYIRSSIALQPNDLAFCTDEHAVLASPDETLPIPFAMEADKWYYVKLYFTGATTTRDIVSSHGLWALRDVGACDLYVDNIRFIKKAQKFASGESGSDLATSWGDVVCTTVGEANGDVLYLNIDFEFVWSQDNVR